jgi:hypothetical protein
MAFHTKVMQHDPPVPDVTSTFQVAIFQVSPPKFQMHFLFPHSKYILSLP